MNGIKGAIKRRESKKNILTRQLDLGTKPVKGEPGKRVKMTPNDIKRVEKEISILEGPVLKYRRKNRKYDKNGKSLTVA